MRLEALVLVVALGARSASAGLSEDGLFYRNRCAAFVAPEDWDEEEDGPFEAPAEFKSIPICPVELTSASWHEKCAKHLTPPEWDEEEDGPFEPDGSELSSCVVLFVPHILDSSATERMDMLGTLFKVAYDKAGLPLVYFWSEAGSQPELEVALDVAAYPKLAVYSPRREMGAAMPNAVTKENVDTFIVKMTSRASGAKPVKVGPVASPEPWDYKSAAPEQCEDVNYDDIELEGSI